MEIIEVLQDVVEFLPLKSGIVYKDDRNIIKKFESRDSKNETLFTTHSGEKMKSVFLDLDAKLRFINYNINENVSMVVNESGDVLYSSGPRVSLHYAGNYIWKFDINSSSTSILHSQSFKNLKEFDQNYRVKYFKYEFAILKLFESSKSIIAMSVPSGKVLWNYHTEPIHVTLPNSVLNKSIYYHCSKHLGLLNNAYYVILQSGLIFGIDIISGRKKQEYLYPDIYPSSFVIQQPYLNHFNKRLQLDQKRRVLFGLYAYWYFEINLDKDSNNYVMYDIRDSLEKFEIGSVATAYGNLPFDGKYIYFSHSGRSKWKNNIGVFDRDLKQVVDSMSCQVSETEDAGFESLKYIHPSVINMHFADNKLYIHLKDSKGSLYVVGS